MLEPNLKNFVSVLAILAGVAMANELWVELEDYFDPCGNEVVAEFPSPDGTRKVVVFQRDCGATTGFSTQASLLGIGTQKPRGAGNLFIADTDRGAAPSAAWGGPTLLVRWEGSRTLILEHNRRARVFHAERQIGSISIHYTMTE